MASIRDKVIEELVEEVEGFYRDALSLSPDEFSACEEPDERIMSRAVHECMMNPDCRNAFYIQLGRIECLQTVLKIISGGKPWTKDKYQKNLLTWAENLSKIAT